MIAQLSAHLQLIVVLLFLTVAVFLFISNKLRMDVVALLVIILFAINGKIAEFLNIDPVVLPLKDILTGFSDPNILLIGALFVIGEGLVRTGIAYKIGDMLTKNSGNNEIKLLLLIMLSVMLLGSFISSTGVVAIFIPIVLSVCNKMSISPSRLMMPLSFSGLMSGMMTLVATAPNLVVNSELSKATNSQGFSFFSITPIGLIIFAFGIIYMIFAQKFIVDRFQGSKSNNKRTMLDLITEYRLDNKLYRFQIRSNSKLIDKNLQELNLRPQYHLSVIGIERIRRFGQKIAIIPTSTTELRLNDILLVSAESEKTSLMDFYTSDKLDPLPLRGEYFSEQSKHVGMAEITFQPDSTKIGKTLMEMDFRNNFQANVVAIKRKGEVLEGNLSDINIMQGDTILVVCDWDTVKKMQINNDIIVLNIPAEAEDVAPAISQAPYALLSVATMIILMVTGIVPNFIAALIACLIMGAFKCIDMDSAYKSIHWPSLILIIGMIPFAKALQITGGVDLVVNSLISTIGNFGPSVMLVSIFAICATVGLFISNTATAVLMAPIAITLAYKMGFSPLPFAMVVTIASSSAFMTPVSSPVNTLVVAPGGYTFGDFVKIGVPFTIIVMIISAIVIPIFFPF